MLACKSLCPSEQVTHLNSTLCNDWSMQWSIMTNTLDAFLSPCQVFCPLSSSGWNHQMIHQVSLQSPPLQHSTVLYAYFVTRMHPVEKTFQQLSWELRSWHKIAKLKMFDWSLLSSVTSRLTGSLGTGPLLLKNKTQGGAPNFSFLFLYPPPMITAHLQSTKIGSPRENGCFGGWSLWQCSSQGSLSPRFPRHPQLSSGIPG